MDIRYFYYRDDLKRPLITLCRVVTEDGITAYGWAICSVKDQPHKDDAWYVDPDTGKDWCDPGGRSIAKARALRALKHEWRSFVRQEKRIFVYHRPIMRDEARQTMQACQAYGFRALVDDGVVGKLPPSMQPWTQEDQRDAATG